MTRFALHAPTFDGTTAADWTRPGPGDFATDDLAEIDDHFLLSETGFPPIEFGDLHCPVVDPEGNLNREALERVSSAEDGVESVDGANEDLCAIVFELTEMLDRKYFSEEPSPAPR
ncbi:hypothetical protein [Haloarchaeobius sp. DFWS5]|uniref:hypothetical protein n=1 Tax=Haloarchaeobius sp. DFWS5 TaxID=3446114 RepID=UPI003EB6C288